MKNLILTIVMLVAIDLIMNAQQKEVTTNKSSLNLVQKKLVTNNSLKSKTSSLKTGKNSKWLLDSEYSWSLNYMKEWVLLKQTIHSYDSSRNRISTHYLNADNSWISKSDFTYDSYGSISTEIDSVYAMPDFPQQPYQWKISNTYTYSYSYNSDGSVSEKFLSEIVRSETGKEYQYYYKDTFTYDTSGNVLIDLIYRYDNIQGYVVYLKHEYTYDSFGYVLTDFVLLWNSPYDGWNAGNEYQYTYNSDGSLNLIYFYVYDDLYGMWENSDYYIASCNIYGNLVSKIDYRWNNIDGWLLSYKYTYNYSLHDDNTSILSSTNSNPLLFYPNPANEKLYINNTNFTNACIMFFDLQGKLELSKKIVSNSIDISELKKGIHIIKIEASGNVLISRLVKE